MLHVIPTNAGIHILLKRNFNDIQELDSRIRGNDMLISPVLSSLWVFDSDAALKLSLGFI